MVVYFSKNVDNNNSQIIFDSLLSKNVKIKYCDISSNIKDIVHWNVVDKLTSRLLNVLPKIHLYQNIYKHRATHLVVVHLFYINLLDLFLLRFFFGKLKIVYLTLDSVHSHKFDFFLKLKIIFFDQVLHTKNQDLDFYNKLGKKQFIFSQGYPASFAMKYINNEIIKKYDCTFIGNYAPKRVEYLNFILNDPRIFNKSFYISGKGLLRKIKSNSGLHHITGPTIGKAYYEQLSASRVNLIFFNEIVNDQTTTRLYELLEVNGIILCEYNDYTKTIFDNGQLFRNPTDLIIKINRILSLTQVEYQYWLDMQKLVKQKINSKSWDECVETIIPYLT